MRSVIQFVYHKSDWLMFCADETKPICQRCTKARIVCGGYRDLAVIQYIGRSQYAKFSRTPEAVQLESTVMEKPKRVNVQTTNSRLLRVEAAPPPVLHLGAIICTPVDEVYIAYTLTHLLRGVDEDVPVQGVQRNLYNKCFTALATTYFGTQHREKSIFEHGLQRYGRALRDVNTTLGDRAKAMSFDTLESVVVMAVFEVRPMLCSSIGAPQLDILFSF